VRITLLVYDSKKLYTDMRGMSSGDPEKGEDSMDARNATARSQPLRLHTNTVRMCGCSHIAEAVACGWNSSQSVVFPCSRRMIIKTMAKVMAETIMCKQAAGTLQAWR
jgi:hypothetical protein